MPTNTNPTYTPGYGGTFTVASATIPVTNVSVTMSVQEIDVTSFADVFVYAMSGRVTRKISCTS